MERIAILMGTRGTGWWPIAATTDEQKARSSAEELNLRAGSQSRPGTLRTMVVMVELRDIPVHREIAKEITVHRVLLDDGAILEESLYSVPFSDSSDYVWTGFNGEPVDILDLLGDDSMGVVITGNQELYMATDPSWVREEILEAFRRHVETDTPHE